MFSDNTSQRHRSFSTVQTTLVDLNHLNKKGSLKRSNTGPNYASAAVQKVVHTNSVVTDSSPDLRTEVNYVPEETGREMDEISLSSGEHQDPLLKNNSVV